MKSLTNKVQGIGEIILAYWPYEMAKTVHRFTHNRIKDQIEWGIDSTYYDVSNFSLFVVTFLLYATTLGFVVKGAYDLFKKTDLDG